MADGATAREGVATTGGGIGLLDGIRVVELADATAEYAGLVLAGMGAHVVKIEPPEGSASRGFAPFAGDAEDGQSLFFAAYNRGKHSVALDATGEAGRSRLAGLLAEADILLTTPGEIARFGLDAAALAERWPDLIVARLTPFGDGGPWKDFHGSDLVHLALGGVAMNCGYDADPSGAYDLPPMAPQVWHAYHIAGDQLVIGIMAALVHRGRTGEAQEVSLAIHEAVAKNTELDVMSWIMRRQPLFRQTCRHAGATKDRSPAICYSKDGRWFMPGMHADLPKLVPFLAARDAAANLEPPAPGDKGARSVPGSGGSNEAAIHTIEVIQRFVRSYTYDRVPWREAQEAGLLWAPLRKPHESLDDAHWHQRGSLQRLADPALGGEIVYPVSKWRSTAPAWVAGAPAPALGVNGGAPPRAEPRPRPAPPADPKRSPHGTPFPLQGVRILDFSWFLASAGGTRFVASLGAESLKLEWKEHPDTRLAAMAPVGGRAARAAATAPLPGVTDPDMGGQFHNKNSGKRGLSLNIRHPKGLAIAKDLVRVCDIVAEGFSPGVLERVGLGYDVLRAIRPDVIYVQQSGMGSYGTYGRLRTVGPVAAAFTGLSEMGGLPEPAMPTGWGYSYLDWIGAYGFATAILGALYHRDRTGEGQWIDSSQCEAGVFLNALPILDYQVNRRPWARTGNRSPHRPAAPHGIYRTAGTDRWIAMSCFTEADWRGLAGVVGGGWVDDPRFATLALRLANQDALDQAVTAWTAAEEGYALMARLQAAGVAAGVCQTAEDRCDRDPQLAHLNWLTEVPGTKIGLWPVPEVPFKLSRTPAYVGGPIGRGAPGYGEDNDYVLGELLGFSAGEIAKLAEEGVI